jgi:hypothetical protein
MKNAPILKDWSLVKVVGYAMQGKKIKIESGQPVYTVSDPAECIYFILEG